MFLDILNKFTRRQYKGYKYELVVRLLDSKEQAEKLLATGEIERYEEVPEQVFYDSIYYDKFSLPFSFYIDFCKLKVFNMWKNLNKLFLKFSMFLKTCLFLLILICIVLFIIFLTYIGYKNIPADKDWIDFVSAIAPTIVGVLSLFIAFYSVFYTKQSIKSQEEQWLKNEFIKRESHLIIEFREKFLSTYSSIFWFYMCFLSFFQ